MSEPWTGLADAIEAIRVELQKARDKAVNAALPLELGPIELQFSVILTREGGAPALASKCWSSKRGPAEHWPVRLRTS
jgi:hypothetical protein